VTHQLLLRVKSTDAGLDRLAGDSLLDGKERAMVSEQIARRYQMSATLNQRLRERAQ